jgi:NH3-dependent NAD+ synthetase
VVIEPDLWHGARANFVVQGSGGDAIKLALAACWERRGEVPGVFPVLAVHDELVFEADEAQAGAVARWLEKCMVDALAPLIAPVPAVVEVKFARTWGGDDPGPPTPALLPAPEPPDVPCAADDGSEPPREGRSRPLDAGGKPDVAALNAGQQERQAGVLAGLFPEERKRHARLSAGLPAEARNDLVFENVQARMRTSLLMNTGFVVGTGDVSELALGWCTYNADHMSMYNPNSSIPKTLVKFLVEWAARNEFEGEARATLLDVVETLISPELLPLDREGKGAQATEGAVGPYELHDFFLYHFLRYGAGPDKILYLASQASFTRSYAPEEVRRWLAVFIRRFFASQYKRSCLPDGPKVGSISLSPRGDWRMPSDASAALWLAWADRAASGGG